VFAGARAYRRGVLFRRSEGKIAQEAAAQAEFERLNGLSVDDLAAELLPAFGPGQKRPAQSMVGACLWLASSFPGGKNYMLDLKRPVQEAIQALEHAGLLTGRVRSGSSAQTILSITRLGETALADADIRRYLQQGRP
jgi:hypothetical protein